MDSGNPITTITITNLQSIATATGVKLFPRPISSATSAPGLSVSETHLLTMNHMAQTWFAKNLVPGRAGIEYMWPGTQSSVDWQIRWAFSSLTASSRHSCSNLLLIVFRTGFNTELVLSGSRFSSPSTCSWTSLAPLSVIFWSSMISFCCSEVIGQIGSYSGPPEIERDVRYFTDNHLDPMNMWNIINSIHSIRTYINTAGSLFPTCCLLMHHSFIFIGYLRSLYIPISSGL